MKKYFDILGLPENSSLKEITNAYRKRLKVVHPDRFDQRTQPEEWEQANRMLQELNDAYAHLKEFHRNNSSSHAGHSKAYEAKNNQAGEQTKKEENQQESSRESTYNYDFFSTVNRGMQRFAANKATPEVREFLKKLHKDKDVLKVYSVRTPLHLIGAISCLALFAFLSIAYYNGSLGDADSSFYTFLILATGGGFGYLLVQFFKFFLCPFRPYFYFTPVYFIHVSPSGLVDFCYLWEINNLVYHDAFYNPYFNIHLKGKIIVATLVPWFNYERFKNRYKELNDYKYEVKEKPDWLFANDHLNSSKMESGPLFNLSYIFTYGAALLLLIVFWSIVIPKGDEIIQSRAATKLENYANRETIEAKNATQSTPESNQDTIFDKPEIPLPSNGEEFTYSKRKCIAPLQIAVPSGDEFYFVKIVDVERNRPCKAVFIHPGQTIKIRVPLGMLRLKYATGQRWFGRKYLFGPDTQVAEADETFNFNVEGNRVSGYTVELIKQQNGNLNTKQISIDNF